MPQDDSNRLEDLKRSLYSRNAPDVRTRRKLRFSDQTSEMKTDWEHPQEAQADSTGYGTQTGHHSMSFSTKLLIVSAVFCVIAVGAGAYVFWNGGNLISANNISIDISGPVSIPGGAPISLSLVITNKNSVTLKATDLKVSFPAGTTDPDDTSKSMDYYEQSLGDLKPGESATRVVRAIIFGEENTHKELKATVTYGIADSSSVFTKEQSYDVLVNSSPVVLSVSSYKEVISGAPFDITVNIKSNSENPLKNVLLKAVYPFGYTFRSASIKPASSDSSVWSIGDMPPGSSRTIVIQGVLSGEDSDLRAFHFNIGAQNPNNPVAIGTSFMSAEQDITIEKPFISLGIAADNNTSLTDYAGRFGRSINVTINWSNNLPESVSNMVLTAHLSGSAYDKNQVTALGGYFRSATDDIIWNQQTNSELASAAAGARGSVSFIILPVDQSSASRPVVNPLITVEASASGDRMTSNVPENTTKISRDLKISSNVSLSGRIIRTGGAFLNTGLIPPKAEQKTTYTVVWTVDNTSSAINNAVVSATLPPYVTWLNQVSPAAENVTYDTNSGTVTWNIGSLNAYTYGTSGRREAQFQVSLLPSVDQIGQVPILVNRAILSAVDNFTKTNLQGTQDYLTTSFSTDSSFVKGNEIVTE
ncbi:MAG: hypothetical protein WCV82_03135 [Candidatus Paceibacterota bacterium]